jgi:hypothetical protein
MLSNGYQDGIYFPSIQAVLKVLSKYSRIFVVSILATTSYLSKKPFEI